MPSVNSALGITEVVFEIIFLSQHGSVQANCKWDNNADVFMQILPLKK